MSDTYEHASEAVHEHGDPHSDPWDRGIAVMISILAAVLAMTEIGEKVAQNAYLTHHISLSNDWAFYQAKNQRAASRTSEADILASLPNAADPAIQARIKAAQEYAARMRDDPQGGDGMKQLEARAQQQQADRDVQEHRYHSFEYAAGALELAIVLGSVSVVTRMRPMGYGAAIVGLVAMAASLAIAMHLI